MNFHPLAARSYKSAGTAYNKHARELFDEITDEACIEAATQKAAEEDDKTEIAEQKEGRGE